MVIGQLYARAARAKGDLKALAAEPKPLPSKDIEEVRSYDWSEEEKDRRLDHLPWEKQSNQPAQVMHRGEAKLEL